MSNSSDIFIQMELNKCAIALRSLGARMREARNIEDLKQMYRNLPSMGSSIIRSMRNIIPEYRQTQTIATERSVTLINDALDFLAKQAQDLDFSDEDFKKECSRFIQRVMEPCRGDFVLAYQTAERGMHRIKHQRSQMQNSDTQVAQFADRQLG